MYPSPGGQAESRCGGAGAAADGAAGWGENLTRNTICAKPVGSACCNKQMHVHTQPVYTGLSSGPPGFIEPSLRVTTV